ncbi:MAG: response regulator transcription factor [Syntrophobacteraceae bacterium]
MKMKTIYLVDDSVLILDRLMELLSTLDGARAIGRTCDPEQALKAILKLQPDIAILDIQLPGMSGIELLRAIKGAGLRTQVVILTGLAYPQYERECMEAGASFFLSKMKDFDLLPSIIGDLIVGGEQHSRVESVEV